MSDILPKKILEKEPVNYTSLINILNFILLILTVWLGITSKSSIIFSQTLILIEILAYTAFLKRFENLKSKIDLALIQVGLATFLASVFFPTNPIKLENSINVLIISGIALALNSLIFLRFENKKLSFELVKNNVNWILVFISGIIIITSKQELLDKSIGFGFLVYVISQAFYKVKTLLSDINQAPKTSVNELSEEIETKILALDKVTNIHDFCIVDNDNSENVTGHIVVKNSTTQEEIFNIKNQTKKILSKFNLENSTLEFEYQLEFEELLKK